MLQLIQSSQLMFYIILKLKFPGSLSRNKGEVWVNVLIDCWGR